MRTSHKNPPQIVDGIPFYQERSGYWVGQITDNNGKPHRKRLHVYVWEKANGEVPKGYDIHHIDHDKSNNTLSNLVAMSRHNHISMHMEERDKDEMRRIMNEKVRPEACKWHSSEAGREWHRQLYETTLAPSWGKNVIKKCDWCGKEYTVSAIKESRSRFCSNKCKTAFRYHSGADNVERICEYCGKTFSANRYSRTKTCSVECGRELGRLKKIGVSRPRTKAL